jgi:hypothetical protein
MNIVIRGVPKANGQPRVYSVDDRGIVTLFDRNVQRMDVNLVDLSSLIVRGVAERWLGKGGAQCIR